MCYTSMSCYFHRDPPGESSQAVGRGAGNVEVSTDVMSELLHVSLDGTRGVGFPWVSRTPTLVGLTQAGGSVVDDLSRPLDVGHQQRQPFRLRVGAVRLHHTFALIFL